MKEKSVDSLEKIIKYKYTTKKREITETSLIKQKLNKKWKKPTQHKKSS